MTPRRSRAATLASQAERIAELLRRVRTLQRRLLGARRTAELRAIERDQALREIAELKRQRLTLARLAAETPQFSNPLVAWEAKALRDQILAGRCQ